MVSGDRAASSDAIAESPGSATESATGEEEELRAQLTSVEAELASANEKLKRKEEVF